MAQAADLVAILEETDSLSIVCHDNPDPDCLASALALETIAESHSVESIDIVYGGEISHQQNRAFVNLLDVGVQEIDAISLEDAGTIAFIDHSRPGANTDLPETERPDIVIDHHPDDTEPVVDATFVDVRAHYGATVTIFVEYLDTLDIAISSRLASAILFALHRERLDYIRDPTAREYEAARTVFPDADLDLLGQLYGTAFSPSTIDAIGRAIGARRRRGSALVTSVGRTTETDALPQAADYLLNVEGVDTVLVSGVVNGTIRLSGRSIDPRVHMGEVLRDAFGSLGSAGGHHDMAGGRIDLGLFADDADDETELLSFVTKRVTRRFFDALNLDDSRTIS